MRNFSADRLNGSHYSIDKFAHSKIGTSQVGMAEDRFSQIQLSELAKSQISSGQVSSLPIRFMSFQPSQIGSSQIGSSQSNIVHPSFEQDCRTQIGIGQVNRAKHNLSEIGSTEIDTSQINTSAIDRDTIEINPTQVNPTKVSLPSSISFQQFFTSHANTFLLTNIYSTPQTLWQTATPINLNFEVTNLPTGQLAEAVITSYDSLGRPNGGTILIDNDANGIGWFIDTTPFDNSEFTQPLTNTAYRATTGEAFGKYDLLTTILHETGHLLGIINGYSEFDRYIQTINNTKTFIGNNITATLTNDGSHLDSKIHPYDLMNNTLAPGVRKLPSWLNLQMLNAIRTGDGGMGGFQGQVFCLSR